MTVLAWRIRILDARCSMLGSSGVVVMTVEPSRRTKVKAVTRATAQSPRSKAADRIEVAASASSSIQYPPKPRPSSQQHRHHPVSSIEYPVSAQAKTVITTTPELPSIEHRVSSIRQAKTVITTTPELPSIEHRVSSIRPSQDRHHNNTGAAQYPASSIEYPPLGSPCAIPPPHSRKLCPYPPAICTHPRCALINTT